MNTFPKNRWRPTNETHSRLIAEGPAGNILVSGPMGVGKSLAITAIMEDLRSYDLRHFGTARQFSASWTTRSPRKNEESGVDYIFDVPQADFEPAHENGLLLEMVTHSGVTYGTPAPTPNTPMLYELEATGLRQCLNSTHPATEEFRNDHRALFLTPESFGQLLEQILGREDGMTEEKKITRVSRYPGELQYIINNDLPYVLVENKPGDMDGLVRRTLEAATTPVEDIKPVSVELIKAKIADANTVLRSMGIKPQAI